MDKKIREIKRDFHMVDGSQGQVAKVAALPSGPHCLHCHGDDDDHHSHHHHYRQHHRHHYCHHLNHHHSPSPSVPDKKGNWNRTYKKEMSLKGDKRDKGDSRDIKTWLAFKPDIQLFVMGSFAMFLLWIGWKNQSCIRKGFTKKLLFFWFFT